MADFSTSYIGGPSGSPVSPQAPVVDESSLTTLGLAGDIAGALGKVTTNFMEIKREEAKEVAKAELKASEDQAVSTFARQQLALVDALETGQITSSAEVRMRMRANLSNSIANNPALATQLAKAHTTVIKSTGLGDVVSEGTEREKQQNAIESDALNAGWVTPDMSDAQKEAATSKYQSFRQQQSLIEGATKQLALQKAQVALTTAGITQRTASLTLAEKQAKIQTQQAIGGMAGDFSSNLLNKLESIRKGKEEGKYTAEQAVMLADQAAFEIQQTIAVGGSRAGADYINNITKPMMSMVENYKGYISGKTSLDLLNTQNEAVIATQTAIIQGDPKMARIVTSTKLFPNARAVISGEANLAVGGYIENGMNPNSKPKDMLADTDEDKKDVDTYFNLINDTVDQVNRGSALDIENTKVEVNNHINGIMKSISIHGPSSNVKDFKGVIDFFASPKIGKYVSTQGATLDEQARFNARSMLNEVYSRELYPLIQAEYKRAVTGGTPDVVYQGRTPIVKVKGQKPATTEIVPVFTGSGVLFQATPGNLNPITLRKVKELNDTAGTLLNKMIHSAAHLEGTTDYKSIYTSMFEQQIFGKEEPDANEE